MKWVSFILFIQASLSWAMELPIRVENLQKSILDQGPCETREAAILCRAMPWPLRKEEGIFLSQGMALIVIRDNFPLVHSAKRLVETADSSRRLELASLIILSEDGIKNALASTGVSSLMLLIKSTTVPSRNRAAFFAPRTALLDFSSGEALMWRERFVEVEQWSPPQAFKVFYQFESF